MPDVPQNAPRRGRALKLALLLLLVGVFGWRIRSCRTQIEEKRRHAAEHEASFTAQTAAEPSPLPLDPYARRAAMADAMRLHPDRRFILAAGQIQQLTRGPALGPEARFKDGNWKLTAGTEQLGELAELPDYPELMRPLVALARRRLVVEPLSGPGASADDAPLQWEPEARAALPVQLALWNGGQRTPGTLHKAARAAAALAFYLVDTMETGDDLAAKAIALVALDVAAGKTETVGEEAVLASALGYLRAARDLAARLPGEPSLRLYLAGDDARLRENANLREAGPTDRYLRLRRALQRNDENDANQFLDSYHGTERLQLCVLALLLREGEMQHFASIAFALPVFVLAAAEGIPVQAPTQDRQSHTVQAALQSTTATLRIEPHSLNQRLEKSLKNLDPDVGGYLRAAWLSALRRQGEYLLDSQGNQQAASKFAEELAKEPAPTVQRFQRWFSVRTSLGTGQVEQAFSAVERLEGVGGSAVAGILEESVKHANFSEPRLLRASRALIPRLDSRVAHRAALGSIAWNPLQDMPLSERLLRSAFEADPDGHQSLHEWFANMGGDTQELERIGRDKFGLRHIRRDAFEQLWKRGGAHTAAAEQGLRAMIDEDPSDVSTALSLGKQLRLAGRLEDASAVVLAWLKTNDGPGVWPANMRAALARYSFLAGHYAEGLKTVGPALPVGNAGSFEYAALNLAGLGRGAEAKQMADALVARYPDTVGVAAEVEWQLGDLDAAAKRLAGAPIRLSSQDYRENVSEGFVRIFGDRPDQAAAAAAALAKAGIDPGHIMSLSYALTETGHPEAAFKVLDAVPVQGERADVLHMTAVLPLRKARGSEAALAWLKQTFPTVPDDRGRHLALLAFREGMPELVWDAVPDPKGTDDYAQTTWMLRAAQVARQGDSAPASRKQALREHYAAERQLSRHTQIGRYLIGELPEAELAKLVTDLPGTCEVPYYFGVRALGEKRLRDAADWYRVAVECGLRHEAEYLFAWNELYRLRGEKNIFALLRSSREREPGAATR
jgi:hypothetical protein